MQNGFTIRARQVANRAGLALLGLALALPAAQAQSQWFGLQKPGSPADQQPLILKKINIQQKLGTQLPLNLAFIDETGKAVHLGDYFGKRPVILSLVYYQCKILCPEEIDGLVGALEAVKFNAGRDFDVVFVSIDPTETPEIAAREKAFYVKRYGRAGTENGWHFLTGQEPAIRTLATTVGFGYVPMKGPDGVSTQYAHASAVELVTPQGRLAQYYLGVEFSAKDIQLGLVDASHGSIGSLVDNLLTYCFRYDPSLNHHTLLYVRIIQAGGLLTVLCLGSFLLINFRRDMREARAQRTILASQTKLGTKLG